MGIPRTTLTSSTTIPDELAFGLNQAWVDAPGTDASGVGVIKGFLKQFQTGLDLKLIANLSTTADDPGRLAYLQWTHTGALDSGDPAHGYGLTGIEVRSTFNGTANAASAEVKGGEFKARHTSGNTFNVGTFKGVVGNVDSKSGAKTITSAWAVEGQIDCGVSSTITTAAGLRVAYNEDGTVTKAYGVYVDGASVWNIGVYCRGGKSVNAIQVGENGVSGGDVIFYSGTTGSSVMWDQSEDNLSVTMGAARAITDADHVVDIVAAGVLSSGDSLIGLNITNTPTGSDGTWVAGIFSNVTQDSTMRVEGYWSAGEFEVVNACETPASMACLVLQWGNSASTQGGNTAYIHLQDWGATRQQNLFEFASAHAIAQNDHTTLLSTTGQDVACDATIRITCDNVPYWIMLTSDHA